MQPASGAGKMVTKWLSARPKQPSARYAHPTTSDWKQSLLPCKQKSSEEDRKKEDCQRRSSSKDRSGGGLEEGMDMA